MIIIKDLDVIYTKLGYVIRIILFDFLKLGVGDKIPTVDEFTHNTDISRGTYFNSLSKLEEAGLVRLEKRGQQGTFITEIDYIKIWSYLGNKNFTIAMAYPENQSLKKLATVINKIKCENYLSKFLIFSRGSMKRIELLKANIANLVIHSSLSAEIIQKKSDKYEVLFDIDKKIYNENVLVYIRKGELEDIKNKELIKLLYDNNSYDIEYLSKELFKNRKVYLVEHSYTQSFELLKNKVVDLVIISKVSKQEEEQLGIEVYEFDDNYSKTLLEKASTISFVYNRKDPSIKEIAKLILEKTEIEKDLIEFENKGIFNY